MSENTETPQETDLCDCGHAWAEHGYAGCHPACKCGAVNPAACKVTTPTPTGAETTTGEGEGDVVQSLLNAAMSAGKAQALGWDRESQAAEHAADQLRLRLAAAEQKNKELEAWRGQLERHLARVRDELTAACIAAEGEDGHLLPNVGADSLHSCMWDAAEMCDDFTMTTIRGTISTQLEESDADRPQQDSQQPVRRAAGRGGQSTEDAGELAGPDEAGRGTSLVRRGPADRGVLGRSVLVNLLGKLKDCAELYGECHAKGEALVASEFMDRMHECESAILREMAELEARVRELSEELAVAEDVIRTWRETADTMQARAETAEAKLALLQAGSDPQPIRSLLREAVVVELPAKPVPYPPGTRPAGGA